MLQSCTFLRSTGARHLCWGSRFRRHSTLPYGPTSLRWVAAASCTCVLFWQFFCTFLRFCGSCCGAHTAPFDTVVRTNMYQNKQHAPTCQYQNKQRTQKHSWYQQPAVTSHTSNPSFCPTSRPYPHALLPCACVPAHASTAAQQLQHCIVLSSWIAEAGCVTHC
jgi:hypothetical protein